MTYDNSHTLSLLLASLIFMSNVSSTNALSCEQTSYGRVCHRLSTGARIAVAVAVAVSACFLVLALAIWRRRRVARNNLTYTHSNAGMQGTQYGGPPSYYQGQSPPQYQGQPHYEQPEYPAPTHTAYEPPAGFAPPYRAQLPQYSPLPPKAEV